MTDLHKSQTAETPENDPRGMMDKKELAWEAWKEAANTNSSMSDLSNLEERTQRQLFAKWWDRNHS